MAKIAQSKGDSVVTSMKQHRDTTKDRLSRHEEVS